MTGIDNSVKMEKNPSRDHKSRNLNYNFPKVTIFVISVRQQDQSNFKRTAVYSYAQTTSSR